MVKGSKGPAGKGQSLCPQHWAVWAISQLRLLCVCGQDGDSGWLQSPRPPKVTASTSSSGLEMSFPSLPSSLHIPLCVQHLLLL